MDKGGGATVGQPRPGEHSYKFVNFLHEYSERLLGLPSQLDEDRPRYTVKRRALVFALQLSRDRSFHSGLVLTWHAAIPFMQSTGEQLREGNTYLSWIPVSRNEPPQELVDYEICHWLVHHDVEWCGILLDPPAAFHPGRAPVTHSDENPPNDPDPEPSGPGWYERAQYTRTDFGPRGAGDYMYHTGRCGDRGGYVLALAHSPCSLQYHTAAREREHRARLA